MRSPSVNRLQALQFIMPGENIIYFIFGLTLVIALAIIIVHYYARRRHVSVEEPKYRMMEEDD